MPTGSCLCHNLKYEYTGDPLKKATCHCLSCRKASGATNTLNILIPADKFRVTAGSAKQFTETHESGDKLSLYFCGECGCAIYKTHETFPGCVIVLAGTLDGAKDLEACKPETELWSKYRVSWLGDVDGAERKMEF